MGTAFYSLDAFLKNLESLDEVFAVVRQELQTDKTFNKDQQRSEADKMLEELGCVEVVSRSDYGSLFYKRLAKQIDEIFPQIVKKKRGAMSLIDVYLYYNRLRGSDLVTCNDLLLACRELRAVNSSLEIREVEGGLKILQLRT